MRFMFVAASSCLLLAASLGAQEAPKAPAIDSLAWMAGHWSTESPGGAVTEESWLLPRAGLMVGVNRSVSPSGRAGFEYLRIEARDGVVSYVASPGGGPSTAFRLTSSTENSATFENPEHDFPKRIVYRLDAGQLVARVDAGAAAPDKGMEWRWSRVGAKP